MKAVLCEKFGPIDTLVVGELPLPEPGEGEVRLKVRAVGLNFPDVLIVQGTYQIKPPPPFSPGAEASGIIDAVGKGVTDVKPGDKVLVMVAYGAMAEYLIAPAARVLPMPENMPFDVAAGFGVTYATAYHALKQRARLQAGECLLVLGAAGGVGLAAVELGKLMGARVIAAASTEEKLALCREYGADETINYATHDLRERIKQTAGSGGPDVIYDPVGSNYAEPAFRSIAWNGRYLVVGFAAGAIPKLALNLPLIKGAAIVGVIWGIFANKEPKVQEENMRELLAWYSAGKLKPHVSKHFTLEQGPEAIQWLAERKALGKVVLKIG